MTAEELANVWFNDVRPHFEPMIGSNPDWAESMNVMADAAETFGRADTVSGTLNACAHAASVATAVFCGWPPSEQLPSKGDLHNVRVVEAMHLVLDEADDAMTPSSLRECYGDDLGGGLPLEVMLSQITYAGYVATRAVWGAAFGDDR